MVNKEIAALFTSSNPHVHFIKIPNASRFFKTIMYDKARDPRIKYMNKEPKFRLVDQETGKITYVSMSKQTEQKSQIEEFREWKEKCKEKREKKRKEKEEEEKRKMEEDEETEETEGTEESEDEERRITRGMKIGSEQNRMKQTYQERKREFYMNEKNKMKSEKKWLLSPNKIPFFKRKKKSGEADFGLDRTVKEMYIEYVNQSDESDESSVDSELEGNFISRAFALKKIRVGCKYQIESIPKLIKNIEESQEIIISPSEVWNPYKISKDYIKEYIDKFPKLPFFEKNSLQEDTKLRYLAKNKYDWVKTIRRIHSDSSHLELFVKSIKADGKHQKVDIQNND